MKKTNIKNILLTITGTTSFMTGTIIIAAILSDKPVYNKSEHECAKQKQEIANESYALTHHFAAQRADTTVWRDSSNRQLVWEIVKARHDLEKCIDDKQYRTIANRYDMLFNHLDELIDLEMSKDSGLIAATNDMAAARNTVEKFEHDSIAYEQWRNSPIKKRIHASLVKIFTAQKQK